MAWQWKTGVEFKRTLSPRSWKMKAGSGRDKLSGYDASAEERRGPGDKETVEPADTVKIAVVGEQVPPISKGQRNQ